MTTQCDPAKLLIIEADFIEHFQLPQCYISSLPEGVPSTDGRFIVSLPVAEYTEFNKSKFVRLSSESFPDLEGSQLKIVRELCKAAHPSEEFFVTIATNQWLRTAINGRASVNLFSLSEAERRRDTVIHSNVLPYDPYWKRPVAIGNEPSSRFHIFPCRILKEAHKEGKTLMEKLIECGQENVRREKCDIGKHEQDDGNIFQQRPVKKFWEVLDNVVTGKVLTTPSQLAQVSQVTWRGGNFIKKDTKHQGDFDAEVNAMERLCHPHIVYIFGINYFDRKQGSLYMECMESDLLALILDKNVRPEGGEKGPPFSHYNSVDILLQIAKAMVHMHENEVIHGDLKTPNILISKFETSENRYHYLAKVADFGSAQVKVSKTFKPADGTTNYAAPEVLEFRTNKGKVISVPENIDVYSFGVVAFEVLTGKTMEHVYKNMYPREVKEGVMNGTLKPPFRAECRKDKFLHIDSLMSLIESCWHGDPSERPPFPEIVEVLNSVRGQILV